jgi:hypothetical protein
MEQRVVARCLDAYVLEREARCAWGQKQQETISFKDSLRRKRGHRDINHLQEEAEVGEEPTQGGIPNDAT